MDESQVRQLLAVVMAYDNRKPGDATVLAWHEAARRGRWTFDEALDAVHAHYATRTEWLMPGHITAHIRARRPAVTMSEAPLPDALGQARVAELVNSAGRSVDDDPPRPAEPDADPFARLREQFVNACPYCHAEPEQPCTRPARAGGRVYLARPHPARTEATA